VIDLYNKFKKLAPITSSGRLVIDQDHEDVRAWLNICELIAVGVNYDAFSESVSQAYWGDVIVLAETRSDRRCLVERSGFGVHCR